MSHQEHEWEVWHVMKTCAGEEDDLAYIYGVSKCIYEDTLYSALRMMANLRPMFTVKNGHLLAI